MDGSKRKIRYNEEMKFPFISLNGRIIPSKEGLVSLDKTEIAYGFGVYETIKVRNNVIYFLPQHIERLLHSAKEINLSHVFTVSKMQIAIEELVASTEIDSCNIKIFLYGASEKEKATLCVIPTAPLYPDRKWYRDGVSLISFQHERWKPQAKTLNMLPSYCMFKEAQKQGCYDALLFDAQHNLREGTRTNVYLIKDKHIYSPQKKDILEGVTLMTLEKAIQSTDYTLTYTDIPFRTIHEFDGMFLTSTSTKIMPVKKIDNKEYPFISEHIKALINIYENKLEKSKGDFSKL